MNSLASESDPKRSGNSGPYFNVLNNDSELFRTPDNSDYAEPVIIPSGVTPVRVRAGRAMIAV
jgi:hypothetical protein